MKKKANKVLIFVFSIMCVCICVFMAQVLSSAITVSGNISTTNSIFGEQKVYAISVGEYTSEQQASVTQQTISKKGGAGYIYEKNNLFYVLASAYEKENDAKLVQKNLAESGISNKIIIIEIDEINFEGINNNNQKKEFNKLIVAIKTVFQKLYDISVSLDTKSIDETKAKIEIIELKSYLETTIEDTSKGTTTIEGLYYQMIKNVYEKIQDNLNNLKNYETKDDITLSSKIKYDYLQVIKELCDLSDLLNNKF